MATPKRTKISNRRAKGKSQVSDHKSRSTEPWERGRGAKRKGNPNYKPVVRNGRKVYVLRNPKKK